MEEAAQQREEDQLKLKKLNSQQIQKNLSDTKNLQQLTQDFSDPDTAWATFRDATYSTDVALLGHPQRNHQDWFDENIQEILDLLARKRAAHAAWLSEKDLVSKHELFKKLRSETQAKIRQLKDAWWKAKAEELQTYTDQHATKRFLSGLKAVYRDSPTTMTPVHAADGTLLTNKMHILER